MSDKWEYIKIDSVTHLNDFGAEGWELVAVINNGPGYGPEFILKRKIDGRKKRAKN
jgi:hypothetical protein